MSNKKFFLGLDVSTTGSKALLVNGQGQVSAAPQPPIRFPPPSHSGPSKTHTIGGELASKVFAKRWLKQACRAQISSPSA